MDKESVVSNECDLASEEAFLNFNDIPKPPWRLAASNVSTLQGSHVSFDVIPKVRACAAAHLLVSFLEGLSM